MILVDFEIERLIRKTKGIDIEPDIDFDTQLQPSSLDLRLGYTFSYIQTYNNSIRLSQPIEYERKEVNKGDLFTIKSGEFVLAETLESIKLPEDISAFVEGRSSIGRAGLQVENAGWIDNGFCGSITLELKNLANRDIVIRPESRICQLVFARTKTPREQYSGKYMGQQGATGSRMHEDKEYNKGE